VHGAATSAAGRPSERSPGGADESDDVSLVSRKGRLMGSFRRGRSS
jgi:hypothetical protein